MQRLRFEEPKQRTVHLGSHRHIGLNGVSARSNAIHYYARRPSSNDSNPRSRLPYQAVARISVLVRRLWAGLVINGPAVVRVAPAN
jgi:hypothetical protein